VLPPDEIVSYIKSNDRQTSGVDVAPDCSLSTCGCADEMVNTGVPGKTQPRTG